MRLKIDSAGKMAIYDETVAGDAPFTQPLDHLAAVRFHTDLGYTHVTDILTGSFTIGPWSSSQTNPAIINLGAHSAGSNRFVLGKVQHYIHDTTTPAGWLSLNGVLPLWIYKNANDYPNGAGIWGHVYTTPSSVMLYARPDVYHPTYAPQITVSYEMWVLDLGA